MTDKEILNILYAFLCRMSERRPDLFARLQETDNAPELWGIAEEFMNWEEKQNGR